MQSRTLPLLLLSLACAGAMAFWLKGKLEFGKDDDKPKPQILVAVGDVKAGSFVLSGKHIDWVDWPEDKISANYITPQTAKIKEYDGAVARRDLNAGEPITPTALVKSDEGGFLAAVMTPGMRAVSIGVSPTTGNAGFIQPGDKVDLILTHRVAVGENSEGSQELLASETFVRNARVLAVDQKIDNPEKVIKVAKTVTLEVSSKQAEMVQVASRLGEISLSLRSLGNGKEGEEDVSTEFMETLTKDSDVSRLLKTRSGDPARVQVIRGNESQQIEFLK